jgi:hypothetical protein
VSSQLKVMLQFDFFMLVFITVKQGSDFPSCHWTHTQIGKSALCQKTPFYRRGFVYSLPLKVNSACRFIMEFFQHI